jgi:uncharacterized membrane protein YobD (UPF0266 family)
MKAHWFQVISLYSFNILTIEFLYSSSIVETQKGKTSLHVDVHHHQLKGIKNFMGSLFCFNNTWTNVCAWE